MSDLILALQIFQKYQKQEGLFNPIHCEHDMLMILGVDKLRVSEVDRLTLDSLGFLWSPEYGCYISYIFGSE